MSRPLDRAYYSRRAAEEDLAGDRSATPKIAAIHYELANRYSRRCGEATLDPPRIGIGA